MHRVNAALGNGELERAREWLDAIVAQQPDYAPAVFCLGKVHVSAGHPEQAVRLLAQACELDPTRSEHWDWLGQAHIKADAPALAVAALEKALALGPAPAVAVVLRRRLASVHREAGRLLQARTLIEKALAALPGHLGCMYDLALISLAQGHFAAAESGLRRVLQEQPEEVELYRRIAVACQRQGRLPAGVRSLELALARWPDDPVLAHHLGALYCEFHQYRDGVPWLQKAHDAEPNNIAWLTNLIKARADVCDWVHSEALRPKLLRAARQGHAVAPFELLLVGVGGAALRAAGERWSRELPRARGDTFDPAARRTEHTTAGASTDPAGRRRIRIGYASADFCDHATARLMVKLFGLHDRHRFEVIAYDWSACDGSAYRQQIRNDCDRFVDIRSFSDAQAATQIAADGIDILIDLKGYTREARPGIFALRPAPVQAHYLGYPASTGADFIDYYIADNVVVPPAHHAAFSESVVTLPGCYQVNDELTFDRAAPSRVALGLPHQGFVFCSFNAHNKVGQAEFEIWMRLLRTVPDSVLWLYAKYPEARDNLVASAASRGVDPGRLCFAEHIAHSEHRERLRAANLFLDSFRYGAHTTASDALSAGVPVLTCKGHNFAARVAASLLTELELPELIARSPIEYERIACRLAQTPNEIGLTKARLAHALTVSSLFQPAVFVRHLETAYETMWQRWMAGLDPAAIEVR